MTVPPAFRRGSASPARQRLVHARGRRPLPKPCVGPSTTWYWPTNARRQFLGPRRSPPPRLSPSAIPKRGCSRRVWWSMAAINLQPVLRACRSRKEERQIVPWEGCSARRWRVARGGDVGRWRDAIGVRRFGASGCAAAVRGPFGRLLPNGCGERHDPLAPVDRWSQRCRAGDGGGSAVAGCSQTGMGSGRAVHGPAPDRAGRR
jgi:hypothetical protein